MELGEIMEPLTESNTVVLDGGNAEYGLLEAATGIDDLIECLKSARRAGAKYVVMESGNYRGAKWASIGDTYMWVDEV